MEIREGEREATDDIIFQRIGASIPTASPRKKFDSESGPLQSLAVSNQFGLTFAAHPQGFCVAKTAELLRVAKDMKDNPQKILTVQDSSIVDVQLAGVSILALSSDGLTLAACVGGTAHFFSVPDLVHKVNFKPFQSSSIYEDQYLREFIWCTTKENAYLALSCEGILAFGEVGSSFKHIEENVTAADWSPDGQNTALLTKANQLSILSPDFRKKSNLKLPAQLQSSSPDNIKTWVDSIKWIQTNCIVIGCVGVNDGEESDYPVYILTSKSGDLFQEPIDAEMLAFDPLFTSIDASILPSNSGPYLLLNYLDVWDLAVVANRRNIDDHIVFFSGVLTNEKKVPLCIEIVNDKWLPRIELQENGDENLVVGIAMDRTSVDFQITIPTDDGGLKALPPCPVLLCMTIEGNLNLFSFARISEVWHVPEVVVAPVAVPASHALVATVKEKGKLEKSNPSNFDYKMPVIRENVNAKALQANKPESQVVKREDSNLFDLQKVSNEIKPISVENTPSVTVVTKGTDINTKLFGVSKHEEEIPKMENSSKFQVGTDYDGIHQVSNIKPFPFTVKSKIKEADVSAEKFKISNQHGEMSKEEDINSSQLQKNNDELKPMLNEKPSVKNQNAVRKNIQNSSGMFSSGQSNIFQSAPKSLFTDSSSFPCSSSNVPSKNALCGDVSVGTFGTQTNESATGFSSMSKFKSELVDIKADPTEISNKYVAGKGSLQTDLLGNMPKTGFGSGSFGSVQSSGHLLTSSLSFSNPSSVSVSAAVASGVKYSYNEKASVPEGVGAFHSANVAATTVANSIFQSSPKTSISSTPEGSLRTMVHSRKVSESFVPSGAHRADLKSTGRPSGMSEIEADFSRELEKVRKMAREVDDLMSSIAGDKMVSKTNSISFRKHVVWSIEDKIKKLSEDCSEFKERHDKQLFDIQNLCAKIMQVDAWRIYMQSIIKQATDQQYQDLRNRQKLNPELDIKRQSISKAEERLKLEILELEGHLQNLEISKFEVNDGPRRVHQKQLQSARTMQSLQGFYNTVNSQLVVAEQLAVRLSQQMEALNISPDKPAKSKNVKKESLFKSIGLSSNEDSFVSPNLKEKIPNSYSLQKFAYSPSSIQRDSIMQEPDSLRRRRDPTDSVWANVGTAKTTVKRASLARSSRAHRSKSSLELTESKIYQLRTSSEMFGNEGSMSPMYQSHTSEGKGLSASGNAATSISTGPSSESFFKRSNYHSKSIRNISSQASSISLKSEAVESRSHLPHASLVEDRTLQKHESDLIKSSSAISAQPKPRAPSRSPTSPFGLTVESQSEGLISSKPSTVASDSASEVTSTFPSIISSGKPFVFSLHTSRPNIAQSAKASFASSLSSSPEIESILPDSSKPVDPVVPEAASEPKSFSFSMSTLATSSAKNLAMSSGHENRPGEAKSSLNASSEPEIKSFLPEGTSLYGSKPQNSAVPDAAAESKPFSFSMSSLATSSGQNLTMSSKHEIRTLTPQVTSLIGSEPQNAMASGAATNPKYFPSILLSNVSGKSITAESGSSLTLPAVTASPINQTISQLSGLGGPASSEQSQLGLTKTSQLGSSSLGTSSWSQSSLSSSTETTVSSMAQTSTSQVSPFASSSPQLKPLFGGFTTATSVASAPAFSFSPTTASGFGQFSAPISGSSGFGSQTSTLSNTSTSFGFPNSSSTQLTTPQSHAASNFGQNMATISNEQKTLSHLTSSTLGQSSMVSGSSSAMTYAITNEEDMEEEATSQIADANIGGFSGFGLGSTTPTTTKSNPFGGPLITSQPGPAFQLSVPTGELFKPASFSIPAAQSSPQSSPNLFGSSFGGGGGIGSSPTASAFGQPAQPGLGQQALGSALGAFGQSRKIGLGSSLGAGFGSPNSLSGSGFSGVPGGGGFAGAAGGGGFAGAAGGGGFAAAAGGGGFTAAATGGGFPAAVNAGAGGFSGGGFQSFSGNQGNSGFSSFGGSSSSASAPQSLFTQMRK